MFNAEKLLGGMLRNAMGGRSGKGATSLLSGGVALGAVGVAMEAVEHFMNKPAAAEPQGAGGPPPMPGAAPPPPLTAGPPPGAGPPPPPPPSAAAPPTREASPSPAVLLMRAMIAAANADGVIDAEEHSRIMANLEKIGLSDEERNFLLREMQSPVPMEDIVRQVQAPELARQVYLVSTAAIRVDTEAEKVYLQKLAGRLGLDPETVTEIDAQVSADGT